MLHSCLSPQSAALEDSEQADRDDRVHGLADAFPLLGGHREATTTRLIGFVIH